VKSEREQKRQMPYVTSVERRATLRATLKTWQDCIIDALGIRFGLLPKAVVDQVTQLNDVDRLQALFKKAVLVDSIDTFQKLLDQSSLTQ
jgi:hypothetical protein